MNCVSIVYKKSQQSNIMGQFIPIRPIKKNVDSYYQRLIEKQQKNKQYSQNQPQFIRSYNNTSNSYRNNRRQSLSPMTQSLNILPIRASTSNIMRNLPNPQHENLFQNKNQKKFRSTFVKKVDPFITYNLKGIKQNNYESINISDNYKLISLTKIEEDQGKKHAKIKGYKKLKLIKPTTVLISIDFILNQNNFWNEEGIDENCYKNWKVLQQCSNIVWLTKRQNSYKKLEKYAHQYGLRLDGVYQIVPKKKSPTLHLTLSSFEKDFVSEINLNRNEKYKNQIIFINSLNVQSIKDLNYQQFYNSFPLLKSLKCIVHFIQIDISDKLRFNSPLKILSKEKLPPPNLVNTFFKEFEDDQGSKANKLVQIKSPIRLKSSANQYQSLSRDQMLGKYENFKKDLIDYFGQTLHISLNKKVKVQQSQVSLQYLIGDMMKRNFSIMYNYQKDSQQISRKMNEIKKNKNNSIKVIKQIEKLNQQSMMSNNLSALINSKLQASKDNQSIFLSKRQSNRQKQRQRQKNPSSYYKFPVYLWKK